jgi:tripartite-type tricarboxylate transporter receptor subunit TctC
VAYAWVGVSAGGGIPGSIVNLLNSRTGEIVNSAEYRSLVEKSGAVAVSSTPQEFQEVIEETAADAAPIFREYGIALD